MPKFKELFSTPKKAALAIACAGVLLVTIGVCIVVYAAGRQEPDAAQDAAIGWENARNFACADAGVDPAAATSVSARYVRWEEQFVYEVEFIDGDTEYLYKIDAQDGSVVQKESKTVKGPGESMELPAGIELEEARATALEDAGLEREQVTFTQAELLEDGAVPVYAFRFFAGNVEYDYQINQRTGAIYSMGTTTYLGQGAETAPPSAPVRTDPPEAAGDPLPSPTQAQPSASTRPQPSEGMAPPTADITPPSANVAPPSGLSGSQTSGQAQITLDEAKQAALGDAGVSGEPSYKKAKLDYEHGTPVYEIEFVTGDWEYEYEIDAATGTVRSKSVEAIAGGNRGSGNTGGDYIGEEQAKAAALGHAGLTADQVTFIKAKLDREDGMYEVEFVKDGLEYEYEINAFTGAVAEFDWDHMD